MADHLTENDRTITNRLATHDGTSYTRTRRPGENSQIDHMLVRTAQLRKTTQHRTHRQLMLVRQRQKQ